MLIWAALTILVIKSIRSTDKYILKGPERQIATLNSVITLQCRVKVFSKYEVHWVKDGFGLGNTKADIRQYGKPINNQHRYDLPFNLEEGEYDLRITDLNLSDEGVFYCQIVVDGRAHSSKKVIVQVLVPSEAPEFIQINNQGEGPKEKRSENNPIIVNDGQNLFLKCIAKHGRPGAILHWFLNDIRIQILPNNQMNGTLVGSITISNEPSEKFGKLYNVESFLKLKINSLKNGNWLKCVAENRGYENEKSKFAAAQIEVHTIPIVQIQAFPKRSQDIFIENDNIEFTCSATGRPNNFFWRWFLNNKPIENIVDHKYKLRINRSHHNAILKCVAISTREGSKSITLLVKYGPKFVNPDSLMYAASIGDTIKMTCEANGNPEPNIHWQRYLSSEILARGPVFIRKDIQSEDFGQYQCTAKSADFTQIEKNSFLEKKRPPSIKQHPVVYGREGQSSKLSCTIESVPLPNDSDIKWIFRNKHITDGTKYKMYKETFLGGIIIILQILFVQSIDFGDYNCTVKTPLGYDSANVIFLKKGETPILLIVGATIIFLFILLVTTIVLCICQRRKLKDDYLKGNPSSPEIPLHHEAKSTLIDSDCHCNPNLYSWIPQSFDVKSQNEALNKIHYQDSNLWSNSEIESCYSNSAPDNHSNNKSVKINKTEDMNGNPILYNMHTVGSNTLNRYCSNLPYSYLSMPRNKDQRFSDTSQYPPYVYQDIFNRIDESDQNTQVTHDDNASSPIYIVKKPPNKTNLQFPVDYYHSPKPIIKTKAINFSSNAGTYTEQHNTKLVANYASNI